MNYKISTILLTVLSVILLSLTIYYANNTQVEYSETIKIDTVVTHSIDTITIENNCISYKDVIILDTVFVKDTTLVVEQKVFEDSISTIYISGINPELEYIEYIEWIKNKDLPFSTENYIQHPVINHNGK